MPFLLDTNVLSELARPAPDRRVLDRFRKHEEEVATATVVWHELVYGVRRMAPGRRRNELEGFLASLRAGALPLLPYDSEAAEWHARERARLASAGEVPSFVDGQIAAIAATNDLVLVTNNTRHFRSFDALDVTRWHREAPA